MDEYNPARCAGGTANRVQFYRFIWIQAADIRNGKARSDQIQALVDLLCGEDPDTLFEVAKHTMPELRDVKVFALALAWPL